MAEESDRSRWNRKYGRGEGPAHHQPQGFLVEHAGLLREGDAPRGRGLALDVACGFGGNSLYLASLGYTVDAMDVSEVALAAASTEATHLGLRDRVRLVQVDLDRWPVPPQRYDVILVFFYLNRSLLPRLAEGLRPGGLFFQANRNRRHLKIRPDFSADYLLEVGELRLLAEAAGLEVIYYADGSAGRDSDSYLIAQRTQATGPAQGR